MMNSALYECTVRHHRLEPKENSFRYKIFMFYLDLDEIDTVVENNFFISHNRFNLFNFRERDHLQFEDHGNTKSVKDQVLFYLDQNGVDTSRVGRIMLMTNLCTLGYQFNPVSFYFCYNKEGQPFCSVVEVSNTYGEMKPYFLGADVQSGINFHKSITKNFYVSPFIAMDTHFDFSLDVPSDRLNVCIHDYEKGKRFFISSLRGKKKALTSWNTLIYALRFPLITLQVITLIHWQAFKLWLKGLNYYKKASFVELQKEVLRPHKSLTTK